MHDNQISAVASYLSRSIKNFNPRYADSLNVVRCGVLRHVGARMGMPTTMSIDGETKNIIPLAILPPYLCDGHIFDQGYSQVVYMEKDSVGHRVASTNACNIYMVQSHDGSQDNNKNRKSIEI